MSDGRSEIGRGGFLTSKNEGGVLARDSGLTKPDAAFDAPGVKVLAAGFGLNSIALTLNFVDAEDVGVKTLLGLETFD